MMTETAAVTVLVFIGGVALVGCAFSALRMYGRDEFRQQAFEIRDELFCFAADGNIAFNHPAYWRLRLMMNATIRFTHRMTFGEMILPLCVLSVIDYENLDESPYQSWESAVAQVGQETREKLTQFHDRFVTLIVNHALRFNPLAWPVVGLTIVVYGLTHTNELFRRDAARVENAAVLNADPDWLDQQGLVAA